MGNTASDGRSYVPSRTFDTATLADRVYQTLLEDILSNHLLPGTPLQEGDIANAFDVSRGPVREALRRLDARGLVSRVPRRGTVVSSLSREGFLDAYGVREVLEVLAIRLAIPHLKTEDLDEFVHLHQEMIRLAEGNEVDVFLAVNTAFHKAIVDCSGNAVLQRVYHSLSDQMRRYQLRSLSLRGSLSRSCEEHAQLIEAMRDRDAEGAAELVREHIRVPQRILRSGNDNELVTQWSAEEQPA